MYKNEVTSAFEILLEEIKKVTDELNQEGSLRFSRSEHKEARSLLNKAELAAQFRSKVKELQNEWQSLESQIPHKASMNLGKIKHKRRQKLKPGLRTPEEDFRYPILESLIRLGGAASINDVIVQVGNIMADNLNDYDKQALPSTPSLPRWRNTAQWTRNALVKDGFLSKDSPKGIWEITEAGKKELTISRGKIK